MSTNRERTRVLQDRLDRIPDYSSALGIGPSEKRTGSVDLSATGDLNEELRRQQDERTYGKRDDVPAPAPQRTKEQEDRDYQRWLEATGRA